MKIEKPLAWGESLKAGTHLVVSSREDQLIVPAALYILTYALSIESRYRY